MGAAGAVLASVGYGPYGAPSTHNAGAAPAFSYTGKPYDAATGLYHFPYRQYDPNAARWLTRDPLGMVDGPNVYAYVMGNPVGAVDPEGTWAVPVGQAVLRLLSLLRNLMKKAIDECKKIRCKVEYHGPHHPFGSWGKLCHIQFMCWRKGVKNLHIVLRIPVPCVGEFKSNKFDSSLNEISMGFP